MEKLKNPPIREAVWEMTFVTDPVPTLPIMEDFGQHLQSSYPVLQHTYSVQVTFGPDGVQPPTQQPDGIRLSNPHHPFVVLLKANVLVVARLIPYTSFEELCEEGLRIMAEWVRFASNTNFTRLALRYVNEYHVHVADNELIGNYVQLVPYVTAQDFPQVLDAYSVRMVPVYSPDKQVGIEVIFQPIQNNEKTQIVLDITVSQIKNFGQDTNTLLETADELRNLKNQIFKQLIGPKAYDLFNV